MAAFLLGNEIHVSTRHIDSDTGITFSATVDTEFVELRKCERSVGTTIRIPISPSTAERLVSSDDEDSEEEDNSGASSDALSAGSENDAIDPDNSDALNREPEDLDAKLRSPDSSDPDSWDWYCLTTPSLARFAHSQNLKQRYAFSESLTDNPELRRLEHPDYDGIIWTYSEAPEFACNGIIVPGRDAFEWRNHWGMECPNIHVRDPDGKLPLNLQRSQLQSRSFPFAEALGLDVARSFCAYALENLPDTICTLGSAVKLMQGMRAPHFRGRYGRIPEWFCTNKGCGFLHPEVYDKTGYRCLVVVHLAHSSGSHPGLPQQLEPGFGYLILDDSPNLGSLDVCIKEITTLPYGDNHGYFEWHTRRYHRVSSFLGEFKRLGTRLLIAKAALDRFQTGKTAAKNWRAKFNQEWETNGWVLGGIGSCPTPDFDFKQFADAGSPDSATDFLCECYFDERKENMARIPLAEEWLRVFGQPLIPFDLSERRKALSSAYTMLEAYMQMFPGEE